MVCTIIPKAFLDENKKSESSTLGASFPNLLNYNNDDIAALSQNGTTYIYHYSSAAQPAVHELTIIGIPGSINNQEEYNLSSPIVVTPNFATTTSNNSNAAADGGNQYVSPYRPLAASNTIVSSLPGQIYVFWADKITGDPSDSMSMSGFAELAEISRPVGNTTWPDMSNQISIPLGSSNSPPNERRMA